ncbi:MAG TPA: hypothetical protein VIV60_30705 [Polyangiaceae bacterium]
MSELVPQAVRDLLAFYTEQCPEVRFGDLDIRVLERAVASIDEAAGRVIAAEEAVAEARAEFRNNETELLTKVGRTLSFLKIFVEDDEERLAKLEAIHSALPAGRRKSKASSASGGASAEPKQRRPRKSKGETDPGAQVEADRAIEAALAAAGLGDDELPEVENDVSTPDVSTLEASVPDMDEAELEAPSKKTSAKSAAK